MSVPVPTSALPREVFPNLFWLASCIEVEIGQPLQGGALAESKTVHAHTSAFLLVGNEATLIVDTGQPKHWPEMKRQLHSVLGDRALDYVFATHPECVHYGNMPFLLDAFPRARAIGDITNYDLFLPDYAGRFERRGAGDVIDLGGRSLLIVEPFIRDLPNSLWGYDLDNRVLFSCDSFAYSHAHNAGECALTSRELPPAQLDDLSLVIRAVMHWSAYTDVTPHFKRLFDFMETYPVDAIAPAHGSFIQDPASFLRLLRQGFDEVRRATYA